MNKVIVTMQDGDWIEKEDHGSEFHPFVYEFENVVGHQIGNGVIQVVFNNGVQKILADFASVDVIPDEETQNNWLERTAEAYGDTSKEQEAPTLRVVKSTDEGSTEEVGN